MNEPEGIQPKPPVDVPMSEPEEIALMVKLPPFLSNQLTEVALRLERSREEVLEGIIEVYFLDAGFHRYTNNPAFIWFMVGDKKEVMVRHARMLDDPA